jgi:hypothetical protein
MKVLTVRTPGGIGFPHAEQDVRITRTRIVNGKTTREMAYLVASLPAEHAQPVDRHRQQGARMESHIETRLHWVRDEPFGEDAHQARTGNGPAVAAVLRNTRIDTTASTANPTAPAPPDEPNRRSAELIDAVTSSNTTTQ